MEDLSTVTLVKKVHPYFTIETSKLNVKRLRITLILVEKLNYLVNVKEVTLRKMDKEIV